MDLQVLQIQAMALSCALISSVKLLMTGACCDEVNMAEEIFEL
jgi:hypothetical protein